MSDLHRAALHSAVDETRTRDLSITSPTFYHKIVPENDAESVFTKAAKTASDVFCRLQLFCQKRSDVKQRESKLLQLFCVLRCLVSVVFLVCCSDWKQSVSYNVSHIYNFINNHARLSIFVFTWNRVKRKPVI